MDYLNFVVFNALGVAVYGPNELPHVGLGDAPKGTSPGLGRGVHAFFCLVSGLQCVGKCVAWIQERWQCNVMLALIGRMLG